MVTGTDRVCTFVVTTGTGPPPPRRPPPGPLLPAPPPDPWAGTAGVALSSPFSHEQDTKRRLRATKTAAFLRWLGILGDKEIVVYVNDAAAPIVYRTGVNLDLSGTSGHALPSRGHAANFSGSEVRGPDAHQDSRIHRRRDPRAGAWHRREQRDVHARQRAAPQTA